MLLPETSPIACPKCGAPIRLTLQAAVRAGEPKYGATVECQNCKGVWVYFRGPPPRYEPLSKPRRKKPPKK